MISGIYSTFVKTIFMDYLATIQAPIRQEIDDFNIYFKKQFTSNVELLNSALSYVCESTGKLMRPMLVLLVAKSLGKCILLASLLRLCKVAKIHRETPQSHNYKTRGILARTSCNTGHTLSAIPDGLTFEELLNLCVILALDNVYNLSGIILIKLCSRTNGCAGTAIDTGLKPLPHAVILHQSVI